MTKEEMLEIYEKAACMDFVLACGVLNGYAVAVKIKFSEMRKTLTDKAFSIQKTSSKERRAGIKKIRCELTKSRIESLARNGKVITLCSESEFEAEKARLKTIKAGYGNGETFEYLINKKIGKVWQKDNKRFDKEPDLEYNGIKYQIKSAKFSLPNEELLQEIAVERNLI
jgi:hypothetical protein